MLYARQSTAQIVTVGPVLDASGVAVTDGVVGDFKISKNGGAPAGLNASATLTHRHTGFYSLSLTATDLNTVGTAEITIDDTVNTCPMKELTVVEPATYDVLFADAAPGPASPTNITAGTIATVTNLTNLPPIPANWLTAAGTAADFTTEIQSGLATAAALQTVDDLVDDLESRIGSPSNLGSGATVAANLVDIEAQTDDIGAAGAGLTAITSKTDNLPTDPADQSLIIAATDAVMSRLGAPAGASVSADVAAVKADTAAVKAKTDLLVFTVAGHVDVNVLKVNGVTIIGDGAGTPFNV